MEHRSSLALGMVLLLCLLGAQPVSAQENGPARINPDQRLGQLRIIERNGTYAVQLREGEPAVPSRRFFEQLREQQAERRANLLFLLFNITSWFNVSWVALGFLGQICFTGRMLVQWIVSEKEGRSVVPTAFWWMSLGGASMLILYFIWRKDIVGVIGQSTGFLIYLRNLRLIVREKRLASQDA